MQATRANRGRIAIIGAGPGGMATALAAHRLGFAGMSIEDGYFLARELGAIDIADNAAVRSALQKYETRRKPHTAWVTEQARFNGRIFHHTPRFLQPLRDFVFDHTRFLQRVIGDVTPSHIVKQLEEI